MINIQETEDENENEETTARQAWCVECDGPVDVNEHGQCISCRDAGCHGVTEDVVLEAVPDSSPRSIECPLCGTDPGEFCHPGTDGDGYNHAARVDEHEEQFQVAAARPRGRW